MSEINRDKKGRFTSVNKSEKEMVDVNKISKKVVKAVKNKKGEVEKVIETPCLSIKKIIPKLTEEETKRIDKKVIPKLTEEEIKRIESRNETLRHMAGIRLKADGMNDDFMGSLLALNLQKAMGNPQLEKEIVVLEKNMSEKVSLVIETPKYVKAQKKAIDKVEKNIIKLKRKIYKKLKNRFGKKVANILMYNSNISFSEKMKIWHTEYPISNKLKEKYKERKELEKDIDEKKQPILDKCPRITPRDTSISDHSNIEGKENVKLPKDDLTDLRF